MAARFQRTVPVEPDAKPCNESRRHRALVEEMCLTGLSVLGGVLFLLVLLLAGKVIHFALTLQNGTFFLPSPGAF